MSYLSYVPLFPSTAEEITQGCSGLGTAFCLTQGAPGYNFLTYSQGHSAYRLEELFFQEGHLCTQLLPLKKILKLPFGQAAW
jgi:hypothetical protein